MKEYLFDFSKRFPAKMHINDKTWIDFLSDVVERFIILTHAQLILIIIFLI